MGYTTLSTGLLCEKCQRERVNAPATYCGLWSTIRACIANLHAKCLKKCLRSTNPKIHSWFNSLLDINTIDGILFNLQISYKYCEFSIDKFINIFLIWNKYRPLYHKRYANTYAGIRDIFDLHIPDEMIYPLIVAISDKIYPGKKLEDYECQAYITFQLTINRPDIYSEDISASNLLYVVNLYYYVPHDIWHMIAEFIC